LAPPAGRARLPRWTRMSMDTRRPLGNRQGSDGASRGEGAVARQPSKERVVMKFGGTSLADVPRIKAGAARVKAEVDRGSEVAVVVSAMAGTTNQLVDWTLAISRMHDAREYDVVVSSGEQVTAGLVALALQELGVPARSWLGWQIPLCTDDVHG